jgi:hypothetical protein
MDTMGRLVLETKSCSPCALKASHTSALTFRERVLELKAEAKPPGLTSLSNVPREHGQSERSTILKVQERS